MSALDRYPPTRTAALERLSRFVPRAGSSYARLRNFDLPGSGHPHVSGLSPYLRHRLITEAEVLDAVLGRHGPKATEKFVQEVFWRTYWKGWLELRPGIWTAYKAEVLRALDDIQTQDGLRSGWEAACGGQTGIACFDAWAQELVQTGYLHNHARMWFASIWIFTLRLPWVLGADFFLRHLLDGDPASNTLGWRWVAGLQTRGKTYLARADNIARYTEGRFAPEGLARSAPALDGPAPPPCGPLPASGLWDPALRSGLVLPIDDLGPGPILADGLQPVSTRILHDPAGRSPLAPSADVLAFAEGAAGDVLSRWGARFGQDSGLVRTADALVDWATSGNLEQIVALHAPVGPQQDVLRAAASRLSIPVVQIVRPYDSAAWPHATHGFFRFKEAIPRLIRDLLTDGLHATHNA